MKRFACEMQEMRSEKSETGNKDFECSHPISHFSHDILRPKNLIGPREMGNGIQTRILTTEVWPSGKAQIRGIKLKLQSLEWARYHTEWHSILVCYIKSFYSIVLTLAEHFQGSGVVRSCILLAYWFLFHLNVYLHYLPYDVSVANQPARIKNHIYLNQNI